MEFLFTAQGMLALFTLTLLEIVLGIDNIIFISIVSNKLPEHQQPKARLIGLSLALGVRILMLFGITWIISFTEPLITILGNEFSGRDIILLIGGLFLIAKSTSEIHHKLSGVEESEGSKKVSSFFNAIIMIVALDIIFSFDSILTAVGMTDQILVMIIAIVISLIIMMVFSGKISHFINGHPTLQMLALSFLILIGFMLALEGFGEHIPKGYIYFGLFYSLMVEVLNMRLRKKGTAVKLKSKGI